MVGNKRKNVDPEHTLLKRLKNGIPFYIMMIPFFTLFFVFIIIPVISSIVISFTDFNMVQIPEFIGMDNYIRLFFDD